ncbi:MAG: malto-oligosyltrehalose trehalohydrolase [Bacteroidetes bacterium]|nr:malto-oligosyltrehalose trehalohydrolase [Bacteroidota bacterium]
MSNVDIAKRTLGVDYKHGKANIIVWAPEAKKVSIHFYNSNKTIDLQLKERGYWQGTAKVIENDTYKFIVDGKELPDVVSLSQPEGVHGPSAVVDLNTFKWTDQQWVNPALDNYIIYELHTGTFTSEGTFAGIESKLDYLLECGITAIEIMPVAQFPGNRNWGYDGVFPFAVQNSYGGPYELQRLVNTCHEKGMTIILDVVYNHMGPEGNYLNAYGSYFTDKYKTPWGDAINFDDAYCDEVRKYFIENALMWFRDFHIDALRLDAVHAIKDLSHKHILQEIKECTDKLSSLTGRKYHLIIECDLNDNRYITSIDEKGYGMDAQWTDEFHHALRVAAGNEKTGYYEDFNGIPDLAKAYKDAYVYDGIYSIYRHRTFGNKASGNEGPQFIVFSQNHDQIGNRMLGERTSMLLSLEMQKLLAGAVIISPYLPLFFMGEEWSAPQPFQYFISHTDEDLVAAVRKGRKNEFASFHNKGEAPDPQAEETFNNCKLRWDLIAQEPHKTMLRYYTALITLRKKHPALHILNRKQLSVKVNKEQNTLVLRRWHAKQSIVCFLNFSSKRQHIPFPTLQGNFIKLFDSASPDWGGKVAAVELISSAAQLEIQPESLLIYGTENV